MLSTAGCFVLPEVFCWSALHGDAGLVRLLVLSDRLPSDTPGRKNRKSFSHSEMDCDTWKQCALAAAVMLAMHLPEK